MRRRVQLAVLASCLLALPSDAAAWAPPTRVQIVDQAVRFMPASLRLALESHRDPLLRGMLEPLADEDAATHAAPWNGGSLDNQIRAAAAALNAALEQPGAFDQVVRRFGELAHYTADAGFPPGVGESGGAHYGHFATFCESRREKFPLVFYGHDRMLLEQSDFAGFASAVLERSRGEDRALARAYAAAGTPPDPSHFGDRSIPFAVGSLAYSRAVNDVVSIWLAVWKQAQGDTASTPYTSRD